MNNDEQVATVWDPVVIDLIPIISRNENEPQPEWKTKFSLSSLSTPQWRWSYKTEPNDGDDDAGYSILWFSFFSLSLKSHVLNWCEHKIGKKCTRSRCIKLNHNGKHTITTPSWSRLSLLTNYPFHQPILIHANQEPCRAVHRWWCSEIQYEIWSDAQVYVRTCLFSARHQGGSEFEKYHLFIFSSSHLLIRHHFMFFSSPHHFNISLSHQFTVSSSHQSYFQPLITAHLTTSSFNELVSLSSHRLSHRLIVSSSTHHRSKFHHLITAHPIISPTHSKAIFLLNFV